MAYSLLSGVKVLECSSHLSGPFCTMLLADLGADVVKIEPPVVGEPTRRYGPFPGDIPHIEKSGLFIYLNANKRAITLDTDTASGRDILLRLIEWADIVVEDCGLFTAPDGLDYASLHTRHPDLIVVSISPFGLTGLHSSWVGDDLTSFHAGGVGYETPSIVEDPQRFPPLKGPEHQADFVAGQAAAIDALMALVGQAASGSGVHIDISAQEAVAHNLNSGVGQLSYDGIPPSRSQAEGGVSGVGGLQPCQDGFVQFHLGENRFWESFAALLGVEGWDTDPRFSTRMLRTRHWALIEPDIRAWTGRYTKQAIFEMCQERGIPCAPVQTTEDLLSNAQFLERRFFRRFVQEPVGEVTVPGIGITVHGVERTDTRSAPLLGQHNEDLLCGVLGHTRQDLVLLRQTGVI